MPFPDSAFGRATPGPWHANADCIEAAGPEGPRDVTVAVVTGYPKGDSNARLIAAAPELLAALCEARDAFAAMDWEGEENWRHWDATRLDQIIAGTLHVVNQAIAKAEGRSE